jgi:hypothetical protein
LMNNIESGGGYLETNNKWLPPVIKINQFFKYKILSKK